MMRSVIQKLAGILLILSAGTAFSAVKTVYSASELKNILQSASLQGGDTVLVADGRYSPGWISMTAQGRDDAPIVIRALNSGQAELYGSTTLNLKKAAWVEIEGFLFSMTAYTAIKLEACHHISIRANRFRLTEESGESGKWLYIGGIWNDPEALSHDNIIEYNSFEEKHEAGNFITIDGGSSVSRNDIIRWNSFRNIGPRRENEMEAIRIGYSELSLTMGRTLVEHNYFENCDGDPRPQRPPHPDPEQSRP